MANYQEFNGIKFYQTKPNDYFRHIVGRTSILMHRYVWEFYNGTLPTGYEVHHIDFNKENNDISNLQAISKSEHRKIHAEALSESQREWRRNNLNINARPKAIEWHKSEEGRKWHSEHAKQMAKPMYDFTCKQCRKAFQSSQINSKFCCISCKSKYRREHKLDNIEAICQYCGETFSTNRYNPRTYCSRSCATSAMWQNNKNFGA